jgi:tetratricopeptide (TPR) repeat protein
MSRGRVRHAGIAALLWALARHNPGLSIVTTREWIADIEDAGDQAPQVSLARLSVEAGRALLTVNGLSGPDAVLRDVSARFEGDALALSLLAGYLRDNPYIGAPEEIPGMDGNSDAPPAARILAAFERRFAVSNPAALAALRMLAIFEEPARPPAVDAVRARPPIARLTEQVPAPGEDGWRDLVEDLREQNLILPRNPEGTIDLHPVVRDYFDGRLREELPEAWREGNNRLFLHYAGDFGPAETVDEIAPLVAAVRHGCRAARYRDAYKVLRLRIQRDRQDYATVKLGASGAVLEALTHFFQPPWHGELPFGIWAPEEAGSRGYILSQAGANLERQGRLTEAIELHSRCLDIDKYSYGMFMKARNERRAAETARACGQDANSIAELFLLTGPLSKAWEWMQLAYEWIGKISDDFWRVVILTTIGEIFHRAGDAEKAAKAFRDAETIHASLERISPELYQAQGFRYCEFLLDESNYSEVVRRAGQAIQAESARSDADPDKWNIDLARDHLVMGRAQLSLSNLEEAEIHLERALLLAREAVDASIAIKGLHARAVLRWKQGERARAWRDLDNALAMCRRSGMRLPEADCTLTRARFQIETGDREKAGDTVKLARELIAATQYGIREREVRELEDTLGNRQARHVKAPPS